MRQGVPADLSRGAIAAVVTGALLLHAAGLWWVLRQRLGEGDAAVFRSPATFAFFVRPAVSEAAAIAPAPRVQRVAAPSAKAVAPRVSVAATAAATTAPVVNEPHVDPLPAAAPSVAPVSEPAFVESAAAPPEAVLVARPDHGRCPPPAYPMLLREQGIEGVVTLRVRVDVQGRATEVHLLRPSGWRLFDEAALQQVRACRFVPARRGGEALASWVEFPVRFALAA